MYDLGLSSSEFWALTPVQFYSLCERRQQDLYRRDVGSGIVASTLANVHRGKDQKAFHPHDFMPKSSIIEELDEAAKPSANQLLERFKLLTGGVKKSGKKGNRNSPN